MTAVPRSSRPGLPDQRHEPVPSVSTRVRAAGLLGRAGELSARDADRALLARTHAGTLDTTHFDTVRFPPPPWAAQRFADAAADGSLAYTPYRGSHAVRDGLAPALSSWLDLPVDPETDLLVSPGTQAGLFVALAAQVDPGDTVVLVDPDYLFSERILTFLGARVRHVPLRYQDGMLAPDIDRLHDELRRQPRMLVFSHPNNPTGAVYPPAVLERIAELATRHDVAVLVDELYGRLVYPGTTFTHLASLQGMRDRTTTLLGPSKTESLSGYRLGAVIGPRSTIDAAEDVLSLMALRAPGYAQHVLAGWLTEDVEWLAERITELEALRQLTVERFSTLPWVGVRPQRGTAYLFPDVSALGLTDLEVAEALAVRADVLISPGYQFGPSGSGHFRVCYARDEKVWDAALTRMVEVLADLHTSRRTDG